MPPPPYRYHAHSTTRWNCLVQLTISTTTLLPLRFTTVFRLPTTFTVHIYHTPTWRCSTFHPLCWWNSITPGGLSLPFRHVSSYLPSFLTTDYSVLFVSHSTFDFLLRFSLFVSCCCSFGVVHLLPTITTGKFSQLHLPWAGTSGVLIHLVYRLPYYRHLRYNNLFLPLIYDHSATCHYHCHRYHYRCSRRYRCDHFHHSCSDLPFADCCPISSLPFGAFLPTGISECRWFPTCYISTTTLTFPPLLPGIHSYYSVILIRWLFLILTIHTCIYWYIVVVLRPLIDGVRWLPIPFPGLPLPEDTPVRCVCYHHRYYCCSSTNTVLCRGLYCISCYPPDVVPTCFAAGLPTADFTAYLIRTMTTCRAITRLPYHHDTDLHFSISPFSTVSHTFCSTICLFRLHCSYRFVLPFYRIVTWNCFRAFVSAHHHLDCSFYLGIVDYRRLPLLFWVKNVTYRPTIVTILFCSYIPFLYRAISRHYLGYLVIDGIPHPPPF